jgi:hypothetical protein
MPSKLLRFSVMLSDQAPTLARIEIEADDGAHGFLCEAGHAGNDCEELSQNGRQDAETG